MAVQQPPARPVLPFRVRWLLWALVALLGAGAGIGIALLQTSSTRSAPVGPIVGGPAMTWPAGLQPAPAFTLRDAGGKPVSPAQYRGRPLIVTFVDPLCHTFCPRESIVLNDVLKRLPAAQRPPVLAVNVDPPVQAPATLRREAKRFRWLPQWRWATGTHAQLAAVWKRYDIAVLPTKGDVTHTEGAYLIDAQGNERALFLWPFSARDVSSVLKKIS